MSPTEVSPGIYGESAPDSYYHGAFEWDSVGCKKAIFTIERITLPCYVWLQNQASCLVFPQRNLHIALRSVKSDILVLSPYNLLSPPIVPSTHPSEVPLFARGRLLQKLSIAESCSSNNLARQHQISKAYRNSTYSCNIIATISAHVAQRIFSTTSSFNSSGQHGFLDKAKKSTGGQASRETAYDNVRRDCLLVSALFEYMFVLKVKDFPAIQRWSLGERKRLDPSFRALAIFSAASTQTAANTFKRYVTVIQSLNAFAQRQVRARLLHINFGRRSQADRH